MSSFSLACYQMHFQAQGVAKLMASGDYSSPGPIEGACNTPVTAPQKRNGKGEKDKERERCGAERRGMGVGTCSNGLRWNRRRTLHYFYFTNVLL